VNATDVVVTGNLNVDLVLGKVATWPGWGREVLVEHSDRRAGGIAHAACALAALGVATSVIAAVGDDDAARFLRGWLTEAGVDTSAVNTWRGQSTGLSVSIVRDDGERTFFTHPGALRAEGVQALLDRLTGRPRWLLVSGLMLLPQTPAQAVVDAVLRVKARGVRIAFDVGWDPDGWTSDRRDWTRAVLATGDLILVNDSEAVALGLDAATTPAIPGATVAIKQGADGATLVDRGGAVHVPGVPVSAVDTVGAGDVWNAAYLAATVHGRAPVDAAAYANQIASRYVATAPGPSRYPNDRSLAVPLDAAAGASLAPPSRATDAESGRANSCR
jgi:sugar/nucleoside kinase (ribokinase family)